MILRDSLGGNCLTVMIATLSMELFNLGESISTCRFAQRVACIANNAKRNEEVDDKSMIKRLKARILELEAELAAIKYGGKAADDVSLTLTDEDKIKCASVVKRFVAGVITDPIMEGISDPYKFRECMNLLKDLVASHKDSSSSATRPISSGNLSAISSATSGFDEPEINKKRPITTESIQSASVEVDIPMSAPANTTRDHNTIENGWTGGSYGSEWNAEKPPPSNPSPKKRLIYTAPEFKAGDHKAREAYRSPLEKKREKDVKKLNTKVERMYAQQLEEQHHLIEFQTSVKEQQLELIEKELEGNIDKCREQLADQHAYVLSLKRNGADPELIDQEKLVERQLKKREHKLNKRLKVICEQKDLIQQKYQPEKATSPRPNTAKDIEDKFSNYVNRDGKLNVRQVKQVLEHQDKQQLQYQKKIERQRIVAVSKQLEVKEMSTRQKLLEFKEKLRLSQSGASPNTSLFANSRESTSLQGWGSPNVLSPGPYSGNHGNGTNNSAEVTLEDVENQPLSPSAFLPHKQNAFLDSKMDEPYFGGFSPPSKDVFDNPFRKSKAHTMVSESNGHCELEQEESPKPYVSPLFKALHGDRKSTESKTGHSKTEKEIKKSSIFISKPNMPSESVSNGFHRDGDFSNGNHHKRETDSWRENSVTKFSFGKNSSKKQEKTDDDYLLEQFGVNSSTKSKILNGSDAKVTSPDDKQSSSPRQPHKHWNAKSQNSPTSNGDKSRSEQLMPSEYVNKSSTDSFDARRMGLSAKSFDAALSTMLGQGDVFVSRDSYDKYSRKPKTKKQESLLARQLSKGRSYDARKHRIQIGGSPSAKDTRSSKNSQSKTTKESFSSQTEKQTKTVKANKANGKTQAETAVNAKQSSSPREFIVPKKSLFFKPRSSMNDDEEGVKPVKITATKESQREETYLSTAQQQKDRVMKIRQAIQAAEVIQRAWHRFKARTK